MTLRDHVRHANPKLSPAAAKLGAGVRDTSRPLPERLADFDRIVALDVGDTGLHRARGLERELGISRLYLKFEGDNPSGTQKDRIAFAQVKDALSQNQQIVVLATCGNYGVAVALACQTAGLTCNIYIPAGYHTERTVEMERLGANIQRLPGTYEDVVTASSALATEHGWYDANPGGANAELQIEAYAGVGRELAAALPAPADWCAVPVSNGTLMAGTYRGLVQAHELGTTARVPHMLAGSSTRKNPIVQSWRKKLPTCVDLDPAKIRETHVNEPLINWHAFDGNEALAAVYETNGEAHDVSDRDLKDSAALIRRLEGYRVLPASTAGLVGVLRKHQQESLVEGVYVAVITARD